MDRYLPVSETTVIQGLTALLALGIFHLGWTFLCCDIADVPGPWHTKLSNIYITCQILRLRQSRAIDKLFATFGPIVRISPNIIAVRNLQAVRTLSSRLNSIY